MLKIEHTPDICQIYVGNCSSTIWRSTFFEPEMLIIISTVIIGMTFVAVGESSWHFANDGKLHTEIE